MKFFYDLICDRWNYISSLIYSINLPHLEKMADKDYKTSNQFIFWPATCLYKKIIICNLGIVVYLLYYKQSMIQQKQNEIDLDSCKLPLTETSWQVSQWVLTGCKPRSNILIKISYFHYVNTTKKIVLLDYFNYTTVFHHQYKHFILQLMVKYVLT